RRLQGLQAGIGWFVQINSGENRKLMAEMKANENPVLQRRAQFRLAFLEGLAERDHSLQFRDFAGIRAILQLFITGQFQTRFNVCREWEHHAFKLSNGVVLSSKLGE